MNVDREDFNQLLERLRGEAARGNRDTLRMLSQAAVSAAHLTSDPAWDIFLAYLQDMLEKATKARDGIMAELIRPELVNADAIMQRRVAVIRLNERIDLLNHIIAMPREIKAQGAIADERLNELQEAEAL